ncbi:hypothetical protein RFI_38032 [Reticulomyxa filosa]|uniref:Uncharacterized protein n=1 Tax=Reticulomyxa filosa TaxID=46433 RepID=X6LBS1_RETFI|nr:hypothetical protein RFI_38032 [Reticulomyxa filosa]|eukprot:ETN99442.1 hypothetical protein RFI_38032 [Reticulomyxa filosa]
MLKKSTPKTHFLSWIFFQNSTNLKDQVLSTMPKSYFKRDYEICYRIDCIYFILNISTEGSLKRVSSFFIFLSYLSQRNNSKDVIVRRQLKERSKLHFFVVLKLFFDNRSNFFSKKEHWLAESTQTIKIKQPFFYDKIGEITLLEKAIVKKKKTSSITTFIPFNSILINLKIIKFNIETEKSKERKKSDKRKTQAKREKTDKKITVHKTVRAKKKKKISKRVYANEPSEAEKENRNEELDTTKQKLRRHYQSQDKLAPLFDDPEQSIDTCYIRLALLTQQQFQQQKDKMTNSQENEKSEEDEKNEDDKEENVKWPNSLDYSSIYGNQTEHIELQDIWNDTQYQSKVRYISIRGEAGSGKNVESSISISIAHPFENYYQCFSSY